MLFGGWTPALTVLLCFMVIDFILGFIVSVMGKSKKSANGNLDSSIGFRGVMKKIIELIAVLIGVLLDELTGQSGFRDLIVMFYIANEGISIVENMGIAGVPLPKKLAKVFAQLKDESDKEE